MISNHYLEYQLSSLEATKTTYSTKKINAQKVQKLHCPNPLSENQFRENSLSTVFNCIYIKTTTLLIFLTKFKLICTSATPLVSIYIHYFTLILLTLGNTIHRKLDFTLVLWVK